MPSTQKMFVIRRCLFAFVLGMLVSYLVGSIFLSMFVLVMFFAPILLFPLSALLIASGGVFSSGFAFYFTQKQVRNSKRVLWIFIGVYLLCASILLSIWPFIFGYPVGFDSRIIDLAIVHFFITVAGSFFTCSYLLIKTNHQSN